MLSFYLALLDDDDEKARFTYIYNTYRSEIWKISLGILRDTTSAYDAFDNTLLAISQSINTVPRDPNYERAYIRLVAKNHALNVMRIRERKPQFISLDAFAAPIQKTPYDKLSEEEAVSKIVEYIGKMPDTYKDALIMKYVYNKSTSEISEALGISANTAKVKIARGTAMLRQRLEGMGIK